MAHNTHPTTTVDNKISEIRTVRTTPAVRVGRHSVEALGSRGLDVTELVLTYREVAEVWIVEPLDRDAFETGAHVDHVQADEEEAHEMNAWIKRQERAAALDLFAPEDGDSIRDWASYNGLDDLGPEAVLDLWSQIV